MAHAVAGAAILRAELEHGEGGHGRDAERMAPDGRHPGRPSGEAHARSVLLRRYRLAHQEVDHDPSLPVVSQAEQQ
jgi:hypothetical protein